MTPKSCRLFPAPLPRPKQSGARRRRPVGFSNCDGSALVELGDLAGECGIFVAALAATLLDLVELVLGGSQIAESKIGLAQIFARQHEVRIDSKRFLIIAEADLNTAGFAMRIAE